MDAQEIVVFNGSERIGWQCGKCTALHLLRHYQVEPKEAHEAYVLRKATECCGVRTCDRCTNSVRPHMSVCDACDAVERKAREAARFAKATKVPLADYKEKFLYIYGHGNEGFVEVEDLADLLAACAADKRPTWGYATSPVKCAWDLENAVREDALQEFHEDASEQVDWGKVEEAQKLIDEALKDVETHYEDEAVAVVWDPALLVEKTDEGALAP